MSAQKNMEDLADLASTVIMQEMQRRLDSDEPPLRFAVIIMEANYRTPSLVTNAFTPECLATLTQVVSEHWKRKSAVV